MTLYVMSLLKGRIFYGLHMYPGVAEYRPAGQKPYRVLVTDAAIREMGPSFEGCPVFVRHVDDVSGEIIERLCVGRVIESFFNKADGMHWAKFCIDDQRGIEALAKKWTLSNCYVPTANGIGGGGTYNGMDYEKEILHAIYEHMAIVPDPRYAESIVLTPDEFKEYNLKKEAELLRLANSKGTERKSMFQFFKREKVSNSADIEGVSVVLEKSGREITITKLINEADEKEMKKGLANGEDKVKVGEEEMTVNDLSAKYTEMKNAKKKNEDDAAEAEKKKNAEAASGAASTGPATPATQPGPDGGKAKNAEAPKVMEDDEKKKNAEAEAAAKKEESNRKENSLKYFNALADAPQTAIKDAPSAELSSDGIARGKSRYGS